MKLVKLNATSFARSLNELLSTLIAAHPDNQQILDDVTSSRVALRVTIDQKVDVLAIAANREDGEQRIVATVDMAGDASEWHAVFPDWNAPAGPIDAVLH